MAYGLLLNKGGVIMAKLIKPTPKLDKHSSRLFLKQVAENIEKKTRAIPTPNIDNTIRSIMCDALRNKKRNS